MPKHQNKTKESYHLTHKAKEGATVISWIAPEYTSYSKSSRWYIAAGLVVVLTLIYAAITSNWTMGLAVIVFTAVYQYTHVYHPPKNIRIELTEFGIRMPGVFFPYSQIQAFWIYYKPGLKTLNLRVAKRFWADVVIQLGEQDPVEVRSFLVGQIAEWEGKDERLSELFLRILKL
jgi:hypothetical protein